MKETCFNWLFAHRQQRFAQVLFRQYARFRPLHRPIFVIGLNRSGTSIFTRLLARSRGIVNWSEANEMWDPAGYPWEDDKVTRPFWPIDPQGYTDAMLADNGASYFSAIPGICAMYVKAQRGSRELGAGNRENRSSPGSRGAGAGGPGVLDCRFPAPDSRFLNKSPMNVLRMPRLRELFPDACFISIVRDPRAVIRSWAEKIIPKLDAHPRSGAQLDERGVAESVIIDGQRFTRMELLERLCASYTYVVETQIKHFDALPGGQRFFTTYESFVADIHGVLRSIDDQFGIDGSLRDFDAIPESQESRNIKFTDEFREAELALVTDRCALIMERLGYCAARAPAATPST